MIHSKLRVTLAILIAGVILTGSESAKADPLTSPLMAPAQGGSAHLSLTGLWHSAAFRTIAVGAAVTGVAFHLDHWAGHHTDGYEDLEESTFDAGDVFGDGVDLAALCGVAWGAGVVLDRTALRSTGVAMVEALTVDAATVTALKLIAGRQRPDGSNSLSFPSGHTSGAFAVSTVLFRRGGWEVGLPAYGLSTLTALARIEDRKHYLSDVVAGAAIGIAVGQLVSPSHHPGLLSRTNMVASPSGLGLRYTF